MANVVGSGERWRISHAAGEQTCQFDKVHRQFRAGEDANCQQRRDRNNGAGDHR
jgi:hypothetical protein